MCVLREYMASIAVLVGEMDTRLYCGAKEVPTS